MLEAAVALASAAALIGLGGWWQLYRTTKRLDKVLGGTGDQTLEQSMNDYHAKVEQVLNKMTKLTAVYEDLSDKAGLASQKISVVRFNPFGDTGGDQSFALAVLDAHDSGYVLTSIHGREGTRVYVKPIDFGASKYTLSVEEQQAIAQATKRVPRKETKHAKAE